MEKENLSPNQLDFPPLRSGKGAKITPSWRRRPRRRAHRSTLGFSPKIGLRRGSGRIFAIRLARLKAVQERDR
jgi:hypothetical protein